MKNELTREEREAIRVRCVEHMGTQAPISLREALCLLDALDASEARVKGLEAERQAEVARLRVVMRNIFTDLQRMTTKRDGARFVGEDEARFRNIQRYIEVIASTHADIAAVLAEKEGE